MGIDDVLEHMSITSLEAMAPSITHSFATSPYRHTCYTLPCENRMDIRCIAISHCGRLVISVDIGM